MTPSASPRFTAAVDEYRRRARTYRPSRALPEHAEHVWAFMADSPTGEMVVGVDGHPMMDTDRQMVELSRPLMQVIADERDMTIRLVRFDRRGQSIATLTPEVQRVGS